MATLQTNLTDGVICDLLRITGKPRAGRLTSSASEQVIDVLHPNRGSVPKEELKEKLAKTYKVWRCVGCCLGSRVGPMLEHVAEILGTPRRRICHASRCGG